MAKSEKRKLARQLRRQGFSVRAIENELDVSRSSVSRWTQDIILTHAQETNLKNNQISHALVKGTKANAEKHINLRRGYQIQGRIHAKNNRMLHTMGCLLYWAEGSKDRNRIEFVNSDSNMMLLFINFLKTELNVDSNDISMRVTCHATEPEIIDVIENYWLDLLGLPQG